VLEYEADGPATSWARVSEAAMSEPNEVIPIDNNMPYDIPDAWWTVAGIIEAAAGVMHYQISDRRLDLDGMRATIAEGDIVRGRISLSGDENKSALTIDHMPGSDAFWNILLDLLKSAANYAAIHRRRSWATTAESAIEHYYRAKARNSRITLKEIAELTGFNYTYLSQVKSAYDKAGKYGAKPKKRPK
jgi:hypothetical protein